MNELLLYTFLDHKGALADYVLNSANYFKQDFGQNMTDSIMGAFMWAESPQGHLYWQRLWEEYVEIWKEAAL